MENKKEWMIAAIKKNVIVNYRPYFKSKQTKFLEKIKFLFEELEDLENKEHLIKIFEIIKSIGNFQFDYKPYSNFVRLLLIVK